MGRSAMVGLAVVALSFGALAEQADAYGAAYYGSQRKTSARFYSGAYGPPRQRVIRTWSLPTYGGGYYQPRYGYNTFRGTGVIVVPPGYYGW